MIGFCHAARSIPITTGIFWVVGASLTKQILLRKLKPLLRDYRSSMGKNWMTWLRSPNAVCLNSTTRKCGLCAFRFVTFHHAALSDNTDSDVRLEKKLMPYIDSCALRSLLTKCDPSRSV